MAMAFLLVITTVNVPRQPFGGSIGDPLARRVPLMARYFGRCMLLDHMLCMFVSAMRLPNFRRCLLSASICFVEYCWFDMAIAA